MVKGKRITIVKPYVSDLYTSKMGGVDRADQLRSSYTVGRPCKKWYRYLFWYALNLAICNARVLENVHKRPATPKRQLDFRLALSKQLIGNFTQQSDDEVSGSEEEDESKSSRKRKMSSTVTHGSADQASSDELSNHVKSKVARVSSKKKRRYKMDKYFEDARYFVMKSNNAENVLLSKAKGVWSTPRTNEKKLSAAYKRYKNVIVIFSVKESGKFQGMARLMGEATYGGPPMPWVLPPGMSAKALGGVFPLKWLNRQDLWFSKCTHLCNPWNDNKEVKICRDGQPHYSSRAVDVPYYFTQHIPHWCYWYSTASNSRYHHRTIILRYDVILIMEIRDATSTAIADLLKRVNQFVIAGSSMKSAVVPGSADRFTYDAEYNLTTDQALLVSDHYPIKLEIYARGFVEETLKSYTGSIAIIANKKKVTSSQDALQAFAQIYSQWANLLTKDQVDLASYKWNDMVSQMKLNLQVKRRRWRMKHYDDVFVASEAVDWLHKYLQTNPNFGPSVNRQQALQLCQKFLSHNIIEDARGKQYNGVFEDNSHLYYFVYCCHALADKRENSPTKNTSREKPLLAKRRYSCESTSSLSHTPAKILRRSSRFSIRRTSYSNAPIRNPLGSLANQINVMGSIKSDSRAFKSGGMKGKLNGKYIESDVIMNPAALGFQVNRHSLTEKEITEIWWNIAIARNHCEVQGNSNEIAFSKQAASPKTKPHHAFLMLPSKSLSKNTTFCERVTTKEFEEEGMRSSQSALKDLLNQIIMDEAITEKERKKKFKQDNPSELNASQRMVR
ncbi:hypothetical protein QZH41_001636 [Actinostola sp. cb2023]|nr:hypothetical protein QZH41_001636 [Actinostola sp. cb2023]